MYWFHLHDMMCVCVFPISIAIFCVSTYTRPIVEETLRMDTKLDPISTFKRSKLKEI